MKCSLCGYQFQAGEGNRACKGCPFAGACHMVKCPNCGYDMPLEPGLITTLRAWRRKGNGIKRTS